MAVDPKRLAAAHTAIGAMEIHQRAHGMWMSEEEVAAMPEPDGTKDCPTCGVTLVRMFFRELNGGPYICAYSQRFRTAG